MICTYQWQATTARKTRNHQPLAWATTMKRIPPKALEWQENHKDNGNDVKSSK